jgi:hypothetical protein
MASLTYNEARKLILSGSIDLNADTIKVMLVGTGYTPNKDHVYVSDLGSNELNNGGGGSGYTAGFGSSSRKTLGSKAFSKDDTLDRAKFAAGNPSWTAINAGTIGGVAVVKEGTSDADSVVIAFHDVSPDSATNGGDWTFAWDSAYGVLSLE